MEKSPVDSITAFFRGDGKNRRRRNFGDLRPEDVLALIKLVSRDQRAVEDVVTFAKTHARVARDITEQDVQAAMDTFVVEGIMTS